MNIIIWLDCSMKSSSVRVFRLAMFVKRRVPVYAHVHISTYGLQFDFPERHFLRDIEIALPELLDTEARLKPFGGANFDARRERSTVASLVAKQKFLNRSIISAAFRLIEAFLSGIFFTAVHLGYVGDLACETGNDEPYKKLIEFGKRYRDAIHHTTPFQRKDVEPGGRLTALYEINGTIAHRCVALASEAILKISRSTSLTSDETEIAVRCEALREAAIKQSA